MNLFENLEIGGETLRAEVAVDDTLRELAQACDYTFDGVSSFTVPTMIPPTGYKLGLIIGGSGTGKSSLLKHFGAPSAHTWDGGRAVASQVDPELLMRIGLSSIPSLCRPYHVLSEGEKHRADIARAVAEGAPVIDEFTSVVHRKLARSICFGVRKLIDAQEGARLVLATCHEDVAEWLEPDWVFNTNTGKLVEGRFGRAQIDVSMFPCSVKAWSLFARHHYLTGDINAGARCWLAVDGGEPAAFVSAVPFPRRNLKRGWRGHRVVVLPDYQGLGLGSRLSDAVAQLFVDDGCRYFAKTAHPKLGEHRERSPLWRATSMNKASRASSYLSDRESRATAGAYRSFNYEAHAHRICYSHEYVGARDA